MGWGVINKTAPVGASVNTLLKPFASGARTCCHSSTNHVSPKEVLRKHSVHHCTS